MRSVRPRLPPGPLRDGRRLDDEPPLVVAEEEEEAPPPAFFAPLPSPSPDLDGGDRPPPSFAQLGLGVSRVCPPGDATDAALRAVRDALGRTALPPPAAAARGWPARGGAAPLPPPPPPPPAVSVRLGVPASRRAGPARPMAVDVAAVARAAAPHGRVLGVSVTIGGMPADGGLCVVVASVTVGGGGIGGGRCIPPPSAVGRGAAAPAPAPGPPLPPPPPPPRAGKRPRPLQLQQAGADRRGDGKRRAAERGDGAQRGGESAPKMSPPPRRAAADRPSAERAAGSRRGDKDPRPQGEAGGQEAARWPAVPDLPTSRASPASAPSPPAPSPSAKAGGGDEPHPIAAFPPASAFTIVRHPEYIDHSHEVPTPEELAQFTELSLSCKTPPFPTRLHRLLDEVSRRSDRSNIVGWLAHGRSFRVLDVPAFVETILPEYFRLTKYCSFLRQLNLYGFRRISVGPDRGSYYSEWFLRGRPVLTSRMRRIKVNGNGRRIASDPDTEPDLYAFPPVDEATPPSSAAAARSPADDAGGERGGGGVAPVGGAAADVASATGLLALRGETPERWWNGGDGSGGVSGGDRPPSVSTSSEE